MSAFDQGQQNHLYYQQQTEAAIHAASAKYARGEYRPHTFRDRFQRYHEENDLVNTIKAPEHAPLRKVRNGKMPKNFYAPPDVIRSFGLDPAVQEYIAPTRRKRWNNPGGGFVVPPLEPEAREGFKRVVKWQDYTQDSVLSGMGILKQPISFGTPMYAYTQAPIVYRPLTEEETQNPSSYTLYEYDL